MATRLIQTINTFQFSPSSPDPAGITYIPGSNQLLIADSEVEEIPGLFSGVNLYQMTLDGTLASTGSTTSFSVEPTGLSYNTNTGTLYVTDDDTRRLYEIASGADGVFGTTDDSVVSSINTRSYGNNDPEDVSYASTLNTIFIAGGSVDNKVFQISTTGTLISSFDTFSLGLDDPEGIVFNPDSGKLFVIGEPQNKVFEVTTDGKLIQKIDISAANPVQPGGLTYAPSSVSFTDRSLYIVDRGIDNNQNPNENDGKVYEFILEDTIYALGSSTSASNFTLNGVTYQDEDVVSYSPRTGQWSQYFDGSDVGLGSNSLDGLHMNSDGTILLSLNTDTNLTGLGFVDDADILRFIPTTTGTNTTGTLQMYFDGSDVGLNTNNEDIDTIAIAPDGRIVISTNGNYSVSGLSGDDKDLLAFSANSLGANTSGSWSFYFDGSDVGLTDGNNEDIKGAWIDNNGEVILSTLSNFGVTGLTGEASDLFSFNGTTGADTSGTFSLFSDGAGNGFGTQVINDFSIV